MIDWILSRHGGYFTWVTYRKYLLALILRSQKIDCRLRNLENLWQSKKTIKMGNWPPSRKTNSPSVFYSWTAVFGERQWRRMCMWLTTKGPQMEHIINVGEEDNLWGLKKSIFAILGSLYYQRSQNSRMAQYLKMEIMKKCSCWQYMWLRKHYKGIIFLIISSTI